MDWQSLIADIQKHGRLTQKQIAATCNCGQASISELAIGKNKNPSFSLGIALVSLHKSKTRRKAVAA